MNCLTSSLPYLDERKSAGQSLMPPCLPTPLTSRVQLLRPPRPMSNALSMRVLDNESIRRKTDLEAA